MGSRSLNGFFSSPVRRQTSPTLLHLTLVSIDWYSPQYSYFYNILFTLTYSFMVNNNEIFGGGGIGDRTHDFAFSQADAYVTELNAWPISAIFFFFTPYVSYIKYVNR